MKKPLLEYFIIFIVRSYQLFLSPLLVPSCRFSPTCSNYTIQAVKKHGWLKGSFYSIKRIIRCRPLYTKTCYDPVP